MFKKIGNLIESDAGFSVETLGRAGLKYTEGQKSVFIDSEILVPIDGYSMAVMKQSIRLWVGQNLITQEIDKGNRDRIMENIRAAFRSQGEEIDVIGDF